MRKSIEDPTDGNMGFPFQQSIRNINGQNTGGRFGLVTGHSKGHLVNVNSRQIPMLGCLEEGKDEDGQSGVGDDDDLELALASQRSFYEGDIIELVPMRSISQPEKVSQIFTMHQIIAEDGTPDNKSDTPD